MKIRNTFVCKTAALTLAALLGIAGAAFAEETVQPRETEAKEATTAEAEIRTFGIESEDADKFELTNSTGKDITFFSIRVNDGTDVEKENIMILQEALIEQGFLDDVADGSFGPKTKAAVKAYREANGLSADEKVDDEMLLMLFPDYDDGNILDDDDVIKADETIVIWFAEEPKEETVKENAEENTETELAKEFDTYTSYVAEFRLADDETEYALNTLALSGETMQIKVEGDVAYIEYQAAGSGTLVSTYENENTIKHPPVATYNDYSDYDDGYYYYEEPVYYEPVYENPAQGDDGCIDLGQAETW